MVSEYIKKGSGVLDIGCGTGHLVRKLVNKGCYVGQEVIARLEHRGHVGKQLRSLKLEGDKIPQRGEKIFSEDGQEIGTVTSSCFSPKFSSPIALGYIRYASLSLKEVRIGNSTANFL